MHQGSMQQPLMFKHTHHFLMEALQALYESIMDNCFKSCFDAGNTLLLLTDIVHKAVLHMQNVGAAVVFVQD